jgi:Mn2+/Fe2+ NRAMP family transporter
MIINTAGEALLWSATLLAGTGLLAIAFVACLALMRWLVLIVPLIILVGFAFEPELQLRFTATLLGLLAILTLPPLLVAWALRQVMRRAVTTSSASPPSALEMAHLSLVDDQAHVSRRLLAKAAREARDRDDRDGEARDLERQGMVSLWSRQ